MIKMTGREFEAKIGNYPSWAKELDCPLEIITYADLNYSPITHLSPLIHFKGKTSDGKCADISNTSTLESAEGTYDGYVSFVHSGLHRIGNIKVNSYDQQGISASFAWCKNLKEAQGKFQGYVSFANSGIEKIKTLHIKEASYKFLSLQLKLRLTGCKHLKDIPTQFDPNQIECPQILKEALEKRRSIKSILHTSSLELK